MLLIAVPAFGSQYHTDEEVIIAWKSGKDFRLDNGSYINNRDAEKYLKPDDRVSIRYAPGLYIQVK